MDVSKVECWNGQMFARMLVWMMSDSMNNCDKDECNCSLISVIMDEWSIHGPVFCMAGFVISSRLYADRKKKQLSVFL